MTVAFQLCFEALQRNQQRLELNGTHPVLVHTDDVNSLGGNINTVKKIQNSY
jgi:hypothetical protein